MEITILTGSNEKRLTGLLKGTIISSLDIIKSSVLIIKNTEKGYNSGLVNDRTSIVVEIL